MDSPGLVILDRYGKLLALGFSPSQGANVFVEQLAGGAAYLLLFIYIYSSRRRSPEDIDYDGDNHTIGSQITKGAKGVPIAIIPT